MKNPFYHRQGITNPRHFYGRRPLLRDLCEMIDSGQSCALIGERRIGKSSLLSFLARAQRDTPGSRSPERTLTVFLDFLVFHNLAPQQLWSEILQILVTESANPEVEQLLKQTLPKKAIDFTDFRRAIQRLSSKRFKVVLLCDEFECAVLSPQFDVDFFGALRGLASGGNVVFVTASRLSLLELEQHRQEEVRQKVLGSPFFNILAEFRLGPFADYELAEMLAGSLDPTPIRFHERDVAFLDEIAGRHPYFLQLSSYHLYAILQREGHGKPSPELPGNDQEHDTHRRRIHRIVREKVWQESQRIFRNQWQHSNQLERDALIALTSQKASKVPGHGITGQKARTLNRLVRRGLVRRKRFDLPTRSQSSTEGDALEYRLFSTLFREWVLQLVAEESLHTSHLEQNHQPLKFTTAESSGSISAFPSLADDLSSLSRYTLEEEIGRGGTGTVYKAWDEHLSRLVAIKIIHPDIRALPERFDRLLEEARNCASLYHRNIVVIYDIDVERGFLVQEYLAGGSLADILATLPVLSNENVLSLALQLADALAAAHGTGIVHRDLKPENILLTRSASQWSADLGRPVLPSVKLVDFGTALYLSSANQPPEESIAGTLAYMAPEQIAGDAVGPAADLYALGVVLFEALHGRRPEQDSPQKLAHKKRPASLDPIVAQCLAPHPRQRPTAEQLAKRLRSLRRRRSRNRPD